MILPVEEGNRHVPHTSDGKGSTKQVNTVSRYLTMLRFAKWIVIVQLAFSVCTALTGGIGLVLTRASPYFWLMACSVLALCLGTVSVLAIKSASRNLRGNAAQLEADRLAMRGQVEKGSVPLVMSPMREPTAEQTGGGRTCYPNRDNDSDVSDGEVVRRRRLRGG